MSNQTGAVGGAAFGGVFLAAVSFPGVGYLCLGAGMVSSAIITIFMRQPIADAKLLANESL
jgi:hypothetical protein